MRIVYVTSSLPYGPGEAFAIPEIRELLTRGHDVRLLPVRPRGRVVHDDARPLEERTIGRGALSARAFAPTALATLASPRASSSAACLALRGTSGSTRAKNLVVLPEALRLARLLRSGKADHVHAYWGSTPATVAMVGAVTAGVPWSFTAHRWDIAEDNALAAKVRTACFVRVVSADGLRDLEARVGAPLPHAQVLHVGVDIPDTSPGPNGTARRDLLRVLVPASLVPVKGHRVLVAAVARLAEVGTQVEVGLAGDGELRDELRALVEREGLAGRIRFLGQLPHPALLEEFASGRWDAVALSSVPSSGEKEGIPVSLLEAMARGLPVVASDLGGIGELLDRSTGLLVPPDDPDHLAAALATIANDPQLRVALGRAGRARVAAEFSVDATVSELERLMARSRRQSDRRSGSENCRPGRV